MDTPLRRARLADKRKLSQAATAKLAQINQAHYWRLEKAMVRASPGVAERLAKIFHLDERKILYPERYTQQRAG